MCIFRLFWAQRWILRQLPAVSFPGNGRSPYAHYGTPPPPCEMELEGVDEALALPPIALLVAEGRIHDTMKRIVELGGPAAASAVIVAVPAMARAGPKTWDLAWYYMVDSTYWPYREVWLALFFQLRGTPEARLIPDYWRRVYVACSMLVRIAWLATYELLLAPTATLSIQPNTALLDAIGHVFGVDITAFEPEAEIENTDPVFGEDTPLMNYALAVQPVAKSIPFAVMTESVSLPPGTEISTDEETQTTRIKESVRARLPVELAGGDVSMRAPARTLFPLLLARLTTDEWASALYDFGETFYVLRAVDRYMVSRTGGISVTSTFRLAGFSASGVLSLWHDTMGGNPPHRWGEFNEAAYSPSSLTLGEIFVDSPQARDELRELFAFGAQRNNEPDLLFLLGDENARPLWMEKLGMRYRGTPKASVVLAAAPLEMHRPRGPRALQALVNSVADLPLVPAGTTLFHATAKANAFAPLELRGDSYFGVNLYHSCAVMLEHTGRHAEEAAVRASTQGRSNAYAILEYETTAPLFPRDVDKKTEPFEELHMLHREGTVAPFMAFIRSYPLDPEPLVRAALLRPALAYKGYPDTATIDVGEGWHRIRHYEPGVQAVLLRQWQHDAYALGLLAVWLGTRPSGTSCYLQMKEGEDVPLDPPLRFMDPQTGPSSVSHVNRRATGLVVWTRDSNAFDERWVLIGARTLDASASVMPAIRHHLETRLAATTDRPLRIEVPADIASAAVFRAWHTQHAEDVVVEVATEMALLPTPIEGWATS